MVTKEDEKTEDIFLIFRIIYITFLIGPWICLALCLALSGGIVFLLAILCVIAVCHLIPKLYNSILNDSWKLFADQFGLKFEADDTDRSISGNYRNHNIWLRSYRTERLEVDLRAIQSDGSIWGYDEDADIPDWNYTTLQVDLNNTTETPINDNKLKRTFDRYIQNKLMDLKNPVEYNRDSKSISVKWSHWIRTRYKLRQMIDTVVDIIEEMENDQNEDSM